MITDQFGRVKARRDFMPFGEEITPDGTHRTTNLKYNFGDNVRQKFTGYQKDEETQLDFAEARMYQNLHARFTAVDPLLASGKSGNPQTFNRYVYVLNNPLIFTDPTGLQVASWTGTVYTNGQTFSREPFVGENYDIVTGSHSRYVDATDGYSYAFNESGSTLLGRTADLNARAARLMPDRIPAFLGGFSQVASDAKSGIVTGAGNFGKGFWNTVTNPLGIAGTMAGVPNPLALERTSYETPRSAAYGVLTEVFFAASTSAATAGAANSGLSSSSMLSVVPQFPRISTPYGPAVQSLSPEALAARQSVEEGALLFRRGTLGTSQGAEGQFWSLQHPLKPNFASQSGLPSSSTNFNFIEAGRLNAGQPFITRPAPPVGNNPGGGIEVVTNPCAVRLCNFSAW